MPDAYAHIRNLPLFAVLSGLGIDMSRFKQRKGKYGKEYYGPCVFHEAKENNTSFSFSENGLFHCFSCQVKGKSAIDLVMKVKECNFTSAVALLEQLGTQVGTQTEPKTEQQEATKLVPFKGSYHKYKVPCEWLTNRIPSQDVLDRFEVFCYNNPARKSAYSNKVMLPIKGTDGQTYGYLGRSFNGEDVKYNFPSSFPKHKFLYGAYEALQLHQPLKVVYLVESPFCVMKYASYGLPAVSPFGWSVSQEQLDILCTLSKGVVYLPDKNKFGQSSSTTANLARQMWVKSPPLPEGIDDPESLTVQQLLAL